MAHRSLRDEMLSGRARPGGRRRRVPVVPLIVVGAVALLALIGLMMPRGEAEVSASPRGSAPSASAQTEPSPTPSSSSIGTPSERTAEAVLDALNGLSIVPGTAATDYDRGYFGQAWFDVDRNGCDTRNDILRRDLHDLQLKADTNGCKVLAGVLDDWYSGATVDFVSAGGGARLVQIDHMVPLSWAWKHGADAWDDQTRREFANDPVNLTATTEQQNASKGDSGPSEWLPSSDQAQCRYAQRFTAVLAKYELGVDLRDRAMLRGVLEECHDSTVFGQFNTDDELDALVADAARRSS